MKSTWIYSFVLILAVTLFLLEGCDPFEQHKPADYPPPSLKISVSPRQGSIHTWFAFSTAGTRDGDNLFGTMLFRWDHNADGYWDTPFVQSTGWVHVFTDPGFYWIRVEAKDRYGQISLDSIQLEVYGPNRDTAHIQDPRDGQHYKTVRLSGVTWLAENLNYGQLIAATDTARDNDVVEKYCLNDNPQLQAPSGGHYTYYDWMEMMAYDTSTVQGICPPGWELPTIEDWQKIIQNPDRNLAYYTEGGLSGLDLTLTGFPVRWKDWSLLGPIDQVDEWVYFTRNFYKGYLYGPNKLIPYIACSEEKRNRGYIYSLNYSNDSIRKYYGITPVRCIKRE